VLSLKQTENHQNKHHGRKVTFTPLTMTERLYLVLDRHKNTNSIGLMKSDGGSSTNLGLFRCLFKKKELPSSL